MTAAHQHIRITGARQHNLKNLSLTVPRRAITAFTGVSGSGKTSLAFDTIAAEAQHQLNETFPPFVRNRLPDYGRPDVDLVEGLSAVVLVNQRRLGGNTRSTVGTITDTYTLLRLLFSRVGTPRLGESTRFSFNDPAGMCPRCAGIGRVVTPDVDAFVDLDRSLERGAVQLPGFSPGQYWYRQYADSGLFDPTTPLRTWSADARAALLHGGAAATRLGRAVPKDYHGLLDHFTRIYLHTEGEVSERKQAVVDRFTVSVRCPDCGGQRLNEAARSVRVAGRTITEFTALEISDLVDVVRGIDHPEAGPVVDSLADRLTAFVDIGLGYLTLDRATSSLSGGESQRIKLVRHLGSSLTEMLYVFDEPSVGLHPADVERLATLLRRLRDKGNTVLVVEHDPDVVAVADHVIDLGPGAGEDGGQIVFQGSVADLAATDTRTGRALHARLPLRTEPRTPRGGLAVTGADRHNLRGVDVTVPTGVLTVITGVAGSGKSSLVGVLLEQHPGGTVIDQSAVTTNRRSNTATYTGIADTIRRRFAKANNVSPALFSANSAGACPDCGGLGVTYTDLAFLEGFTSVCGTCRGRRFTDEVLRHTLDGRSIADVLDLTVAEARSVFRDARIAPVLAVLAEVGLAYLTLGQPLNTLSGGECQRLKLATELHRSPDNALYVLDEPTTGLHPSDVGRLVEIFDRLVDAGNTVVVVEHNLDVIRRADWVIDLGPGAGHHGGRVLHSGPPAHLARNAHSLTGEHLRRSLAAAPVHTGQSGSGAHPTPAR
ncbi:ATP-binding cassette domain-containing protein [Goodfellowiella coeruleoviolacea]|uniref:UvrABC system protein A n=1 Tax=Goodfellowiella coeruleoviolacea TaxID=334858 RepID=A0AAE3GD01_9PSEU|nr:excinuclease ABC subunit UvrA [Goodfellowiella coeruleoviolacea]MCP2165528.1 excinuclease ABC, A subunit [Goodfellowiella coeruleoviolacea]